MTLRRHLTGQNIALVTVFAAVLSASAIWGGVEFVAGVPFTLQTFAVMLAGAVLGPWRGAAAVVIYLVLGTAGVPVFAGHVPGAVAWPSTLAGFLLGFVPAAFVTGWIVRGLRRRSALTFAGTFGAAVMGGIVVLYPLGWGYVAWKAGLSLSDAVVAAAPFVVFDLVKCVTVALVAGAVHRAYPAILPATPRPRGEAKPATASGSETSEALTTAYP